MTPFVPTDYSTLKRDIVIVGDGIAGLTCALALAEKGIKPLVVTRGKGNTYLSQSFSSSHRICSKKSIRASFGIS
jgi:thioredoxin reductase